jgi:Arc/MetJ-type ribon-helix-helix transcriptional regulator
MADNETTTTITARLPAALLEAIQGLVEDGWFRDLDDVLLEALRRYLDARPPELLERFARQDVDWGLHGRD